MRPRNQRDPGSAAQRQPCVEDQLLGAEAKEDAEEQAWRRPERRDHPRHGDAEAGEYRAHPGGRKRRVPAPMAVSAGIPILVCMTGDATTPEIPPGLLEEYLAGMRVLLELLVGIADRLAAVPGDTVALEELRRETHKIHGSAGSYGFTDVSRLAAGMEETVKDWVARPDDRDVDRGSLTRWFVGRLADMLDLGGTRAPAVPRTASRRPLAAPPQLKAPEVICVEDDPALAELLEYGLRTGGYRFLAYRNGRE